MNWLFIVMGNLIMDVAIGLFAVLAGFEARLHRRATMLEQEGQIRQFGEMHNEGRDTSGLRPLTDEEIEAGALRHRADRISPTMGDKPYYFLLLFTVGVIFQLIGLIINDIIFDF